MTDDEAVEGQIARPPRAPADVVHRCGLGLPVVVRMPPVLSNGEPFPTRYWLTCPLAHRRIARLEAARGVAAYDERLRNDPSLREALERRHLRVAEERAAAMPSDALRAPTGGVGGITEGVKCLHLHFADELGSGENPIGFEVAEEVMPLDCTTPCVELAAGRPIRSPSWREPRAPTFAPIDPPSDVENDEPRR